jgi:RND family efflux transporter MFP subunit
MEPPVTYSVTRWTDSTELFAEYAPLVARETSRFGIHLTDLGSFKPVPNGEVVIELRSDTDASEAFRIDGPSQPGIFGIDVTPSSAGTRDVIVRVRAHGLEDEHHLGTVEVHASAEARPAAAAETEAGISFLKEQQWNLDFGTAVVRQQSLRESIRVPARVQARPGGAADVIAPIDGRLTQVLDVALGANVSRGQELTRLLPPPSLPGDLPQLQRARADAHTALALATHDRGRAERLVNAGAAPQKRLEEAQATEDQAKARLSAAEATLAQYHATRAGGAIDSEGLFIVRAPISGVIALRDATTGGNVTAGALLFRVVDASNVHIGGEVPEVDTARVRLVAGADIELVGDERRVPAGRVVSVGKVLDPQTRTLPMTFAFDNRAFGLPIGQAVFLHLLMDNAALRPVVPAAAVVDDAGRPIVFVQRAGETFERRPVRLGARDGDLVQITDGVSPGERVVTRGAYLVRLASLSTSVPAEGHVH